MTKKRVFRVWTFDPVAFHQDLESRILIRGIYRADRLRGLAIDAAQQTDATVEYYLDSMGFPPSEPEPWWSYVFAEREEDAPPDDLWYLMSMGPYLHFVDGASYANWRCLEFSLLEAGWRKSVFELLYGEGIETLLLRHADYRLLAPIARNIRGGTGGWLSAAFVQDCLVRLEGESLARPEEASEKAAFEIALDDLRSALTVATQRNHGLRLIYGW